MQTSARMPGGPSKRTLSFSSSALRPTHLANHRTTRRSGSCHKAVRNPSNMHEIEWLPKTSTIFIDSEQPLIGSVEDRWHRAHLKFSLTGLYVGKRSRLKMITSKSRFSIVVKGSVGIVARQYWSPRFELKRAARHGCEGQSEDLTADSTSFASNSLM